MVTTSILCLALLLPLAVAAQDGTVVPKEVGEQFAAAAKGAGTGQQEGQIELVIARIIKVALSLMGVLMVALLVFGGYLWMTAAGNEEQMTKAKQLIRNAIIGIIIILSAYAISIFVINRLLYATRGTI